MALEANMSNVTDDQEGSDMMGPSWIDHATEEDLVLLFPLGGE
jgi:hypothetical protein